MIFVTVGTTQYPFDRLLKAIDCGLKEGSINQPVFAQIGSSKYQPLYYEYEKFLPHEKVTEYIQKADVVVTHAGVGSTLLCLTMGKIPILFPRRRDCNMDEIMDNHQLDWANQMNSHKKVLVAYDERELFNKLKNYKKLIAELPSSSQPSCKNDLAEFLGGILKSSNRSSQK